jgi:hypothetical protein
VVAASQLEDAIHTDDKNQVIYFTKYNALGGGWTQWTEVDRTFLSVLSLDYATAPTP